MELLNLYKNSDKQYIDNAYVISLLSFKLPRRNRKYFTFISDKATEVTLTVTAAYETCLGLRALVLIISFNHFSYVVHILPNI